MRHVASVQGWPMVCGTRAILVGSIGIGVCAGVGVAGLLGALPNERRWGRAPWPCARRSLGGQFNGAGGENHDHSVP